MHRRVFLGSAAAAAWPVQAEPARVLRVVTAYPFRPYEITRLEQCVPGTRIEVTQVDRDQWNGATLRDAEVIFGEPSGRHLDVAPKLKWVQVSGAGVEWMDERVRQSDVLMTNMKGTFAPGIAETAMGLLLSLTRQIAAYQVQFHQRKWEPIGDTFSDQYVELGGKLMGIVGFGGIGQNIGRRAHFGFDMRIVATDAKPQVAPEWVEELREPAWYREMATKVDVLVSAAPLTPLTKGMFDEALFKSMKKTAYFIAMSRGGLFDDQALVKALRSGWIAGAGLDVFPVEPVPASHPIYDCPNVVMTPHSSGWGPERQERLMRQFAENLRRYVKGLPLQNLVDKRAGY